jgi:hypothetical protein
MLTVFVAADAAISAAEKSWLRTEARVFAVEIGIRGKFTAPEMVRLRRDIQRETHSIFYP